MPHFGINQLLLSPLKCAICSGIGVRFDADFASNQPYFGNIHIFDSINANLD